MHAHMHTPCDTHTHSVGVSPLPPPFSSGQATNHNHERSINLVKGEIDHMPVATITASICIVQLIERENDREGNSKAVSMLD